MTVEIVDSKEHTPKHTREQKNTEVFGTFVISFCCLYSSFPLYSWCFPHLTVAWLKNLINTYIPKYLVRDFLSIHLLSISIFSLLINEKQCAIPSTLTNVYTHTNTNSIYTLNESKINDSNQFRYCLPYPGPCWRMRFI